MGRPPKRSVLAAAEASTTPPATLTPTQSLARIVRAEGKSLYTCSLPDPASAPVLVELAARFRNAIWVRRGGYVLVDIDAPPPVAEAKEIQPPPPQKSGGGSSARVVGEIVNVVRDEREWRKQPYWPETFRKHTYDEDSDDEDDSRVGKMPPSDSEEDE